jgi:hypothetical protein
MPLLDEFWRYSQSDWPAPILCIPASTTKTDEFSQMVRIGIVREGKRHRYIECPCCKDHSDEPQASELPDGTTHFLLACPNCGGVEVTADDMRVWCIHFSELPGMMSALLDMRKSQTIVPNALWKMGRYGKSGDIWFGRWLHWPEAKDWLSKMPKTAQTILLYLGLPPDFNLLADIPQGNVIDAADIFTVNAAGLHVDMGPVDAALQRSAHAPIASSAYAFRQEGDYWRLVFDGKSAMAKHTKGMLYIHYLLEIAPRQESTLQLRRVADPDFQSQLLGDDGEILDERALYDFENRLSDIKEELQEAMSNNDLGRQSKLLEEQLAIENERDAGSGLSGRRRRANDDLERNRKAVCNAISSAIKNIAAVHPKLGGYLKTHISSGDHCSYRQEPGMVWST